MAMRRAIPEEWVPSTSTKIYSRPTWEPRDERVRLPRSADSPRPAPIHLLSPPAPPSLDSPPLPFKDSTHARSETSREPEIVDLAAPSTWPRRGGQAVGSAKLVPSIRIASPSLHSRCSTARQSEISFGILDYYTRDPSPLHSPDLLPPPTPKVDPAMEQFDFQLVPSTPDAREPVTDSGSRRNRVDTKVGADKPLPPLVDVSAPTVPTLQTASHKRTYSLFPTIKGTPSTASHPQSPSTTVSPTSTITSVTSHHQHPDPSYRPRKESLSSSIHSRKDSFTSFRSNRRIPLRILSNSSTPAAGARTVSISTSSPPERLFGHSSRWSDESAFASPTAATTPGPRTSFGSLLREVDGRQSESGTYQYPACFFEDDEDEAAPLRKKFGWTRRSTSLTVQERQQGKQGSGRGRFDGRETLGYRLKRVMLCGGCGSVRPREMRGTI